MNVTVEVYPTISRSLLYLILTRSSSAFSLIGFCFPGNLLISASTLNLQKLGVIVNLSLIVTSFLASVIVKLMSLNGLVSTKLVGPSHGSSSTISTVKNG